MVFVTTAKCGLSTSIAKRLGIFCRFASSVNIQDIFNGVKDGDLQKIQGIKTDHEILSTRDKRGWGLLSHAVKHGHLSIVEHLIGLGANPGLKTYSGHNAYDIAKFWKQNKVRNYLENNTSQTNQKQSSVFFTQNPLERQAERRKDNQWLFSAVGNPKSKFILMYKSQPIVIEATDKLGKSRMKLLESSILQTHNFITENRQNLIFLGVFPVLGKNQNEDYQITSSETSPEMESGTAWFAIDVSHVEMKDIETLNEKTSVLPVYPGVLQISAVEASIIAQARSLTDWHFRYKFCPTCGSKTELAESGYKRICQNSTCLSHSGLFNTNYPRVDPTVITTILSPNKDHCLLARKKSFPPGMFTCVAGFVEPGESIESACMREVEEEVGVKVTGVEYIASQPWPMPSVLMLGCHAYTEAQSNIKLDEEELEEARWFPRQEVVEMITQTHRDRLFVPPHQAIAHQVIKHWLLDTCC